MNALVHRRSARDTGTVRYFINDADTVFRRRGQSLQFYGSNGWVEVLLPLRSDQAMRRISWLQAQVSVVRRQVGYWRFLFVTGAK